MTIEAKNLLLAASLCLALSGCEVAEPAKDTGTGFKDLSFICATYVGHWPNQALAFFDARPCDYNVVSIVDPAFKNGEPHVGACAELPALIELLHKNGAKALLSLPGDKLFLEAVGSDESRERFCNKAVAFMRAHGYDGISIDWEHSVEGHLDQHYLLIRDLRKGIDATAKAGAKGYLSTALHPYVTLKYPPELARLLCREIDWIDLMTYDMCTYAPARHNAPLAPIVQYLAKMRALGFPPDKTCLGLASYGYRYNGIRPGEAFGKNESPQYVSWTKFKTLQETAQWKASYDPIAQAGQYFSPDGKDFITIDTPDSLAAKATLVLKDGYRGVFWWEFSYDLSGGRQLLAEPVAKQLWR